LILVDSSGWIEFFGRGTHAAEFDARLRSLNDVITPTIAIYEVYKWVKRERSEYEALRAIGMMQKTQIVDLTEELALRAADLSLEHGLAMADSIMLACAEAHAAELVTTDSGFQGIAGVTVFSKKRP
jgi:predicted nucleic acid-binding protein